MATGQAKSKPFPISSSTIGGWRDPNDRKDTGMRLQFQSRSGQRLSCFERVDSPGAFMMMENVSQRPAPNECSAHTFIVGQCVPARGSVHKLESLVRDLQVPLVRFEDPSPS